MTATLRRFGIQCRRVEVLHRIRSEETGSQSLAGEGQLIKRQLMRTILHSGQMAGNQQPRIVRRAESLSALLKGEPVLSKE